MPSWTRRTGAPAAPAPQQQKTSVPQPGWGEIVAGLVIMGIAVYRLPPVLAPHAAALGPLHDLALLALPALAAGSGFVAAARARVRSWNGVGVRRASAAALLTGAALGAGTLALTVTATALLAGAGIPHGAGRPDVTLAGFLVLGVLTPLTQELLLRGVVTTALLRHGAVVGVLGSGVLSAAAAALVGTLLPGSSVGVVAAAVIGLVAAILLRRTGSVWPGVVAHAVCNLLALTLVVLV